MLAENNNFGEAGHIGDELLSERNLAMRSQCLAVESTVSTGVLTLEKALRIYKVPFDTYVSFVANNHLDMINTQVKSDSTKDITLFRILVMEKIFELSFSSLKTDSVLEVIKSFVNFSKEVEEDKVVL